MMNAKEKLLWIWLALAVITTVAVVFIIDRPSSSWMKLSEFEEYSSISDSKISEICLRKTIDSANWAVFSDEDLIQTWTKVLNNMEVKRADNSRERELDGNGGGGSVVKVKTETAEFSLIFNSISGGTQLEINGVLYDIREPEAIPFDETYDIAIVRHGVKTPWSKN